MSRGGLTSQESAGEGPRTGATEWLWRLLLLAAGLGLGLLGGELAVRLLRPQAVLLIPDEMYALERGGFGLRPGFRGTITDRTEFTHRVAVNSAGLRGPEAALTTDGFRILALGDSFTFGIGVEDQETFVCRLEQLLERSGLDAVALNAGVPGYSIPEAVARFARYAEKLEPDLAILAAYAGNDLQEAAQPESGLRGGLIRRGRQARSIGWMDWLYHNSHLYVLLKSAVPPLAYEHLRSRLGLPESHRMHRLRHEVDIYRLPQGGELAQAGREATDRALERLVVLAARRRVSVIALIVPAVFQIDPKRWRQALGNLELDPDEYDVEIPTHILQESFEAHGIPTLDLTPIMKRAQQGEAPPYFAADRHWTPAGHRLAAEQLVHILAEHELLPGPAGATHRQL